MSTTIPICVFNLIKRHWGFWELLFPICILKIHMKDIVETPKRCFKRSCFPKELRERWRLAFSFAGLSLGVARCLKVHHAQPKAADTQHLPIVPFPPPQQHKHTFLQKSFSKTSVIHPILSFVLSLSFPREKETPTPSLEDFISITV